MSKTNRAVFFEYCRNISKYLSIVGITCLIYAISSAADMAVPPNAKADATGHSWVCNSGYQQQGLSCVVVKIPEHGILDATGHNWICSRGFQRQGELCVAMPIAEHATFDAVEHKLDCQAGYELQGPVCVPIKVPENASLDSTGHRWECRQGFRDVHGTCVPMTPAELQYQKEFDATVSQMKQISKEKQLANDESCDTDEKTKTRVCVKRTTGQIHCEKNVSGKFYNNCNVTIEYQIATAAVIKGSIDTDIECYAKIKYTKMDSNVVVSNPETSRKPHTLQGTNRMSGNMDIKFNLNASDQVQKADIDSAQCTMKGLSIKPAL